MRKNMLACLALALLTLPATVGVAAEDKVLAEVGSRKITVDEFQQLLRVMRESGGTANTLETLTPSGREKILSGYLDKKLYALAAQEEGLDKRADVRFWIDEAVDEVLAKKFLEIKIAELPATDADLKRFYDSHPDEFHTPSRVKARHILVQTKEQAEAALARVKAGELFEKVAAEISVDATTKGKGGDLGWVTPGVMVEPFDRALFALKKGALSGVVKTNFGYHVIKVEDVQEPALPPFESIKELVKQKSVVASIEKLNGQLASRHPVQVHREALQAVK
jgi:peptidyl-prolyl cis-trans isomerase C